MPLDAINAPAVRAPWKNLGQPVDASLSAADMLKSVNLDWEVEKRPIFVPTGADGLGAMTMVKDRFALVRTTDDRVMDLCGKDYIPNQNANAFSFFYDFAAETHMKMESVGIVDGGRRVFAIARMETMDFSIGAGDEDQIRGYMLLSNPHIVGRSLQYLYMPTRAACWNIFTSISRQRSAIGNFRMHHTKEFSMNVKLEALEALKVTQRAQADYQAQGNFLASKRANNEDVAEYFTKLFQPKLLEEAGDYSRTMIQMLDIFKTQPGVNLSGGSWWTAFNAVTYYYDHEAGRSENNRFRAALFGSGNVQKNKAMNLALEYAGKV